MRALPLVPKQQHRAHTPRSRIPPSSHPLALQPLSPTGKPPPATPGRSPANGAQLTPPPAVRRPWRAVHARRDQVGQAALQLLNEGELCEKQTLRCLNSNTVSSCSEHQVLRGPHAPLAATAMAACCCTVAVPLAEHHQLCHGDTASLSRRAPAPLSASPAPAAPASPPAAPPISRLTVTCMQVRCTAPTSHATLS